MTGMTAIYGTGVNDITEEVLVKTEKREQLKRNFHRCLEVDVCPKCGDNLIVKHSDDENDWETLYDCAKCHFQYAKH